jgi:hypothetical protein
MQKLTNASEEESPVVCLVKCPHSNAVPAFGSVVGRFEGAVDGEGYEQS